MGFRVRLNGWLQTIVILISIVGSAVAVALSVQAGDHKLETSIKAQGHLLRAAIVAVQAKHDLDMASIYTRLTMAGFSLKQAQRLINELRKVADHPIPDLE